MVDVRAQTNQAYYYNSHLEEWRRKYPGHYVLISGGVVSEEECTFRVFKSKSTLTKVVKRSNSTYGGTYSYFRIPGKNPFFTPRYSSARQRKREIAKFRKGLLELIDEEEEVRLSRKKQKRLPEQKCKSIEDALREFFEPIQAQKSAQSQ